MIIRCAPKPDDDPKVQYAQDVLNAAKDLALKLDAAGGLMATSGAALAKGPPQAKVGGAVLIVAGAGLAVLGNNGVAKAEAALEKARQDPPDPAYKQVALPERGVFGSGHRRTKAFCTLVSKRSRSACEKGLRRLLDLLAVPTKLAEGAGTTFDRVGTAAQAGDGQSVALQNAVLKGYAGALVDAYAQIAAAAKSLRAKLKKAGRNPFVFTGAGATIALATLDHPTATQLASLNIELAREHTTLDQVRATLTPVLTRFAGPQRTDTLAGMVSRIRLPKADALHRSITLGEVGVLLTTLKAQRAISGKTAKKLTADYAAVTKAKSAKKRRAALKKLIGHARAKHTKAGDFLATAAGGAK